ncbi:MAG TPA: MFS transporter [Geminicoccus sp.]|jgi:MFS family permease|uniref:MFS transporter n=1 Tax=Geminicoccus sp. TaxID=2024832 RepID=UPI002E3239CA|nr:MFS transporter [Geminicoccus sp.]HEX2528304.1 MFS transporter [Geminicoccus sp.]
MQTRSKAAADQLAFVVGCGCLVAMLTFGARAGFGLFLEPMSRDVGFGREEFSVAIGVQNILWGIGQPIAGALADRFGTRKVLIGGSLIYALGFAMMAQAATPFMLYLSTGVLIGIGGAGASFALIMAAVGRMVPDARRSWALGIVVASSSLGQFLISPLSQAAILAYGWQTALLLLAGLVLLVIPLATPYAHKAATAPAPGETLGRALKDAARHRSYWLLTAGFFVCGFHVAFIQTHLPAYVMDSGVAPWVGGWAIALVGLGNIVGSYTAGVLGGKMPKRWILSFIYVGRAVIIAIYVAFPPTATTTLVFALVMGLLWLSTVPPTSGLVAVMFGPRYMGTLFGIVFLSHQVGALIGVWMGGWWFDQTGSYGLVWIVMILLGILAALVHLPIVETPARAAKPLATT